MSSLHASASASASTSASTSGRSKSQQHTKPTTAPTPTKSTWTAFLCLFLAPFTGLHHLYLHRDGMAFLWAVTAGGFGYGLLYDLFTLSHYVTQYNASHEYIEMIKVQMKHNAYQPTMHVPRFMASISISLYFIIITYYALVYVLGDLMAMIPAIMMAAVPPYIIYNSGITQTIAIWKIMLGAALGYVLSYISESSSFIFIAFAAANTATWTQSYRIDYGQQPTTRPSLCRRLIRYLVCVLCFQAAIGASLYYNASVTLDGETIHLRDHMHHIWNSPAWKNFTFVIGESWSTFREHGFENAHENFFRHMDVEGEQQAYQTLGIKPPITEDQLRTACKKHKLASHPDKAGGNEEKFRQVTQACDVLTKLVKKRQQKSSQSQAGTKSSKR